MKDVVARLRRPSVLALVLANLIPLFGVLLLDWRVFDIVILYWAENVVIGGINVLRMLKCESGSGSRYFLIPFFALHYGVFCVGHYTALTSIFGEGLDGQWSFAMPLADAWQSPLWLGVAAMAISHLLSFKFNFLDGGEYRRTSLRQLMHRPYGRIIALHIAIIAGGFLVSLLDNPMPALLVLIVIKIAIDTRMHVAERRSFAVG